MASSGYSCASIKSWLSSLGLQQFTHRTRQIGLKKRRRKLERALGPLHGGCFVSASIGIGAQGHWYTFDWIGWCYHAAEAFEHLHIDHREEAGIRATWRALIHVLYRDVATVRAIRGVIALTDDDPSERAKFIMGLWELLEDKLGTATVMRKIAHRQELRARRLDLRPMEGFDAKDQATERLSDAEWLAECLPPKVNR